MIQRYRPLPSLVSANVRDETKIGDMIFKLIGDDKVTHLIRLVGHFKQHGPCNGMRIRCHGGFDGVSHGSHQSCTSN